MNSNLEPLKVLMLLIFHIYFIHHFFYSNSKCIHFKHSSVINDLTFSMIILEIILDVFKNFIDSKKNLSSYEYFAKFIKDIKKKKTKIFLELQKDKWKYL